RSLNPALDLQPPEAGVLAYAQGPSLWRSRPLSCSRLFPATQQCAVQTDPRRPYFGHACLGQTEQLSRYRLSRHSSPLLLNASIQIPGTPSLGFEQCATVFWRTVKLRCTIGRADNGTTRLESLMRH